MGPFFRKPPRVGSTDTMPPACDNRDFVLESHRILQSLSVEAMPGDFIIIS
jgi:hypothetical protein